MENRLARILAPRRDEDEAELGLGDWLEMTGLSTFAGTPGDIRSLRMRMGLNQSAFASLLDVNQATVSRWERGQLPIDASVEQLLLRLQKAQCQGGMLADVNLDKHWPWLLRFYRTFRNISQEQLAEIIGCSVESVSRWERGLFTPDIGIQIMLRDLILAPLDSDNVLRQLQERLEVSPGLYNANWGNLVLVRSQGLRQFSAKRGYPSTALGRVDQIFGGLYEDWLTQRKEAGFFRGEALLSYGYFRVKGDDTRLMISLPVTLETGSVMSVAIHLPWTYPPELEKQVRILHSDSAVG